MQLQIHSNVLYLNEPKACSTAGGHFFLSKTNNNNKPIFLNGAVHTLCTILCFVVAFAAEAELGMGKEIITTLNKMGHPQQPIPIHVDNATIVGIANQTIKPQKSQSMEMRYFWIQD